MKQYPLLKQTILFLRIKQYIIAKKINLIKSTKQIVYTNRLSGFCYCRILHENQQVNTFCRAKGITILFLLDHNSILLLRR